MNSSSRHLNHFFYIPLLIIHVQRSLSQNYIKFSLFYSISIKRRSRDCDRFHSKVWIPKGLYKNQKSRWTIKLKIYIICHIKYKITFFMVYKKHKKKKISQPFHLKLYTGLRTRYVRQQFFTTYPSVCIWIFGLKFVFFKENLNWILD